MVTQRLLARIMLCQERLSNSVWASQVVVYFLLAVYLDNVIDDANGVGQPLWYFLQPSYWVPRKVISGMYLCVREPSGHYHSSYNGN